jgi:hypothetical protein
MPDCPAFGQSGTGMNRTNDAGTGPVPDLADAVRHFLDSNSGCRNADAGVSFLDADAQLCTGGCITEVAVLFVHVNVCAGVCV